MSVWSVTLASITQTFFANCSLSRKVLHWRPKMADCDGALRLRFKFRTRRPCDSPISSGDYKRILPARRMKGLESVPDPRSAEELWPDPQPRGKTRRERTAGTRGTGECCLFIAGQPPVAALNSRAKSVGLDVFEDLNAVRVVEYFGQYLQRSEMRISRAEAEQRMFAKLNNPGFLADVRPLLAATEAAQLTDGAMKAAFVKVFSRFVTLLPGDQWARSEEMRERFEIVL